MLAAGNPETLGYLPQHLLKFKRVDTVRVHHGPDNGIGQDPVERRFAMTIHRWALQIAVESLRSCRGSAGSCGCRLIADLLTVGYCGPKWNSFSPLRSAPDGRPCAPPLQEKEKVCPAQDLRVDCSDELNAPVGGDADVRQHTIVELLEFANITVNASLRG